MRKYRYATRENISKRKMGRNVMNNVSYLAVDTEFEANLASNSLFQATYLALVTCGLMGSLDSCNTVMHWYPCCSLQSGGALGFPCNCLPCMAL